MARAAPELPAITLGQPTAWAVAEGHRSLLNLKWTPPADLVGQTLAIHVLEQPADLKPILPRLKQLQAELRDVYVPGPRRLAWGCFVAIASVAAIHERTPATGRFDVDPWWQGPFGIELRAVTPVLPPLPAVRQGPKIWPVHPMHVQVLRVRYQNGRTHLQRELERAQRRAGATTPDNYEEEERRALMEEGETG